MIRKSKIYAGKYFEGGAIRAWSGGSLQAAATAAAAVNMAPELFDCSYCCKGCSFFAYSCKLFGLQLELFRLQWGSVSEPLRRTVSKEAQLQAKKPQLQAKKLPPAANR